MFRRLNSRFVSDPLWQKVVSLSLVLFFIFLADAILSSWVPGLVEDSFRSSLAMGFILSFSSIVGLTADLIFPQILKGISFKKLIMLGILLSLAFSTVLIFTTDISFILIFLIAMMLWGVYYEVIGFANHQFVADSVPTRMHASTWAFIGVFKNLAYFLGPLLAGFLIAGGARLPAYTAIILASISLIILSLSKKHHDRPLTIEIDRINFVSELEHWGILFKKVWPILIISTTLGIIDAFFWTTGAVYTEHLTRNSFWGRWFLPFYALPSLFVGFILVKRGIFHGKKRAALKFFLLSGIFLAMLNFYDSIFWQLLIVFCSSLAIAISYPLVEGVYSDIIDRMGKQRKHMMGLCASTTSISYIVGPILAGTINSVVGSAMTFVYLGWGVVIISLILLFLTPKKLKLPQKKIKGWTDT